MDGVDPLGPGHFAKRTSRFDEINPRSESPLSSPPLSSSLYPLRCRAHPTARPQRRAALRGTAVRWGGRARRRGRSPSLPSSTRGGQARWRPSAAGTAPRGPRMPGAAAGCTLPPFPYKRDRARRRPSVAGAAPRGPRLGRAAGGAWPRPRRPAVASADPTASPVLLPLQRSAQRNGSSSSATARNCFGSGSHSGSVGLGNHTVDLPAMAERLWIYGEENGHRQLSALRLYLAVQWGRDEEQLAPSKTTGTVRHSTAFTTLPAPALERSLPFASPPDHPWAVSISLPCLRN